MLIVAAGPLPFAVHLELSVSESTIDPDTRQNLAGRVAAPVSPENWRRRK